MTKTEAMIELLRIAVTCVSPSVNNRADEVARTAKEWYKVCIDDSLSKESEVAESAKAQKRLSLQPKTVI